MRDYTHNVTCFQCKRDYQLMLVERDYKYWLRCKCSVKSMFPYLTADERELLMSGMCGECYDDTFKEVE